jgi:hypothetical protein
MLLLVSRRIRQVAAYRILALYWMLNGFVDLFSLDINPFFHNFVLRDKITFWYNILDTPLVLLTFALAVTGKNRRILLGVMATYVAAELAVLGWKGYSYLTTVMIDGVGPLLVLICSTIGLVQYMRKVEHTPLENAMVFVYAAMLFCYGSFLLIFVVMPSYDNTSNYRDTFLLYYISALISVAVTIMGLWSYGLRPKSYSSSSS